MPQHSKPYKKYSELSGGQGAGDFLQLKNLETELFDDLSNDIITLDRFENLLREDIDAKFNIISLEVKSKQYPTGVAWVRDATAAKTLDERIEGDHPLIEANNTLLRCLSRLRAIDHTLAHHQETDIRSKLRPNLALLTRRMLNIAYDPYRTKAEKNHEFKTLEVQFNDFLIQALFDADLDGGCQSKEDYEQLLFHYRNLASLLDPAKAMVTLLHDKENKVLHRTTQYPVTKKTSKQKNALVTMGVPPQDLNSDSKDYHANSKVGFQKANNAFSSLLQRDDRRLPAQARKTHLPTAKNAYIVSEELVQLPDEKIPQDSLIQKDSNPVENTLWYARSGSPVYVGKGETRERLDEHADENITQIFDTANEIPGNPHFSNVNVTSLLTNAKAEKQNLVIDVTKNLIEAKSTSDFKADDASLTEDDVSSADDNAKNPPIMQFASAPVNLQGASTKTTIVPENLDDVVTENADQKTLLKKKSRFETAVSIVLGAATHLKGYLSLFFCQSGQDRTGTVSELVAREWKVKRYMEFNNISSNDHDNNQENTARNTIEQLSAAGGNAVEMAAHAAPGSRGMKTDSIPKGPFDSAGAFSKETQKALYLPSAKTNKGNPVEQLPSASPLKNSPFGDRAQGDSVYLFPKDLTNPRLDLFDKKFIDGDSVVIKPTLAGNNNQFYEDVARSIRFNGEKLNDLYQNKFNKKWEHSDKDAQTKICSLLSKLLSFSSDSKEIKALINDYHQQIEYILTTAIVNRLLMLQVIGVRNSSLYKTADGKIGILAKMQIGHLKLPSGERYAMRCSITADWQQNKNNVLTLKSIKISGPDRNLLKTLFLNTPTTDDKANDAQKLRLEEFNIQPLKVLRDDATLKQRWRTRTLFSAADTIKLDNLVKDFCDQNNLNRGDHNDKDLNTSMTELQLIKLFNATSAWLEKRDKSFFNLSNDIYPSVENLKIATENALYKANQAYSPNNSVEKALETIQKFMVTLEKEGITNSSAMKKIKMILEKARENPDTDLALLFIKIRTSLEHKLNDYFKEWWSKLSIPFLGKKGRDPKVDSFYKQFINTSLAMDSLTCATEAKKVYTDEKNRSIQYQNPQIIQNEELLIAFCEKFNAHDALLPIKDLATVLESKMQTPHSTSDAQMVSALSHKPTAEVSVSSSDHEEDCSQDINIDGSSFNDADEDTKETKSSSSTNSSKSSSLLGVDSDESDENDNDADNNLKPQ